MTLIFSLMTQAFVIQVSDRRLTKSDGSLFEDQENKCIFHQNRGTIAYTGLARIGLEPTADWALDPLYNGGGRLAYALASLQQEATQTFRRLRRPAGLTPSEWAAIKRTTFVCVGYQRLQNPAQFGLTPTPDQLYPFCDKVTNAEREDGTWEDQAADNFYGFLSWLADVGGSLTWSGEPLKEKEKTKIVRQIWRCCNRTNEPEAPARLLARQIREVHERQVREKGPVTVGKSVMCAILKRPNLQQPTPIQSAPISFDAHLLDEKDFEARLFRRTEGDTPQRFLYYPGDTSQRKFYMPNTVTDTFMAKGGQGSW
jgi:hypothetical protein